MSHQHHIKNKNNRLTLKLNNILSSPVLSKTRRPADLLTHGKGKVDRGFFSYGAGGGLTIAPSMSLPTWLEVLHYELAHMLENIKR